MYKIALNNMIYEMNNIHLYDVMHISNILKTNLKVSVLRIGHVDNISEAFKWYISLVPDGGLIIIDQYDHFKPLLNHIYLDNKVPYETLILGQFTTLYCNHTKIILRRELCKQNIKFAIVMASYHRSNGKSKTYIERSLKSIKDQEYKNYKLFLIGDKYEDQEEFESYKTLLPADKIEIINLPTAFEREHTRGHNLWCVGGATAMNYGLDLAVKQGFTHYVHLDDDDYWNLFHLRNIAMGYQQFPEAHFITTMAVFTTSPFVLPPIGKLCYDNFQCTSGMAFHSAWGFRLDKIPLKYNTINLGNLNAHLIPADGDMLNRINALCKKNNYHVLGIPTLSCFYETKEASSIDSFLCQELVNEINRSHSNLIVNQIAHEMAGYTYHHHYHLLYDLRTLLGPESKNYMEIGVCNGGSLSLILQHPYETNLRGIDVFAYEGQYDASQKNVVYYNKFSRNLIITKTNSHSLEFVEKLKQENYKIDLLFIDGSHTYEGVTLDFELYSQFLNPGGYIVFDDYNDADFSPEVKPAVDDIVKNIGYEYHIIGSFPNFLKVHPSDFKEYNEFIIRKL